MGSLLVTALTRARGFLVEPAPAPADELVAPPPVPSDPLRLAVIALSRRSGATTVALGLARSLAGLGPGRAHVLSFAALAGRAGGASGLTRWEIPAALGEPHEVAEYGATVERLAGTAAALVWDFSAGDCERASAAIGSCDRLVGVASGSAEPALAELVCAMLAERAGNVRLVANRVRDAERWEGRCTAALPESRLGALLIAHGRMPRGQLGLALRRLAAAVREGA